MTEQTTHLDLQNDAVLADHEFNDLLTSVQPRIRGYIASMLSGWPEIDDLVQETNMVILRKRNDFMPGTNFVAWVLRIAHFKVSTWRRDHKREEIALFKEQTFQEIATMAQEFFESRLPVLQALEQCLSLLPQGDREIIRAKYQDSITLVEQAKSLSRSPEALRKQLSRLRLVLRKCIESKVPNNPPIDSHEND